MKNMVKVKMNKFSFSRKILILLLSLCILIIFITSYISISMMEKQNFEQVKGNLVKLNASTYNLIDTAVEISIKNYLKGIADNNLESIHLLYQKSQSGAITEDKAKSLVSSIISNQTVGKSGYSYILDSSGDLLEHPFLKGYNIHGYNMDENDIAYRQFNKNNDYFEYLWENPLDSKSMKKVVYMRYFEPWDYIICVSAYKMEFIDLVKTKDFRDHILDLNLGKTGNTFVLDSSGTLIIHSKQEGENTYNSTDSKGNYFVREILQEKTGSMIYPWKYPGEEKAKDRIMVYDYYDPMDWYICNAVNIDELTEPFDQMKLRLFIVMILVLIFGIAISIYYSKLITTPINKLISAMEQVEKGNCIDLVRTNQKDEIGQLSIIYNKLQRKTLELEELSNIDALTGIANRRKLDRYFNDILEISKKGEIPISVIMIDIDFFKYYNDTYGHLQGDKCLIQIAQAIQDTLERPTDFVGRYGGEEFSVCLLNTNSQRALQVAKRIQSSIHTLSIKHESSSVSDIVTVSMGIATTKHAQNKTIEDLYLLSDQALYAAKQNGSNRIEVINSEL